MRDSLPKNATKIIYEFPLHGGAATDVRVDSSSKIASFVYSNLTSPGSVYVYNLTSNSTTVFKTMNLDHLEKYYWWGKHPFRSVEQKQSTGNVSVPAFVLKFNENNKISKPSPIWLNAYGGFNVNMLPKFNPFAMALTTFFRPSAYVLVNIRGGREYGRDWYLDGRNLNKQNCFDDLISACEYFILEGYTSAGLCGINGGSNGGLLAGAVSIQAPQLFGVGLADYGVHDTLRFTNFTFGPGWQNDYGHKENGTEILSVLKWAPVYNVDKIKYPAMLITTGDHDTRVSPTHSYKFAAYLQWAANHISSHSNPVFLRVRELSGHNIFSLERKVDAFAEKVSFWAVQLGAIMK
ncbi:hypothetical protein HK096_006897 [Nowakowskiella sp. JEL0078]|nr:hypothetical protein HK096_006897 [Nowakowskiella sp. JEL0078]